MATYIGTGSSAANTGAGITIVPGLPSGYQAGDILVVGIETDISNPISIPNWTQAPNSPLDNDLAYTTRLHVYWRRATGDANDTCTITISSADHGIAQMMAFRGCVETGDPWDITNYRNDTNGVSYSIPTMTTTKDNEKVVVFCTDGQDSPSGGAFTLINANYSGIAVVFSIGTSAGNGGQIGGGYGTKDTAGADGNTTGNNPTGLDRAYCAWKGALKNPVVALLSPSFLFNMI